MSIEQEIENLNQLWVQSFIAKDAAACTKLFTEDGWIFSPYSKEAHGHDAIQQTHQEWIDAEEKNKSLTLVEISVVGNLAYTIVSYSGDYDQDDGSIFTETGKSVNVYKRQSDGNWKFHTSSLNSDVPPSAS